MKTPPLNRIAGIPLVVTGLILSIAPLQLRAQVVQNYNFSQTSGTFTSLGNGATTVQTGNGFDDQTFGPIALPQTFYFNNIGYNAVYLSANGFITFGTAPAGNNYTPLSSNAGYSGAISAFGADLQSRNQPGNSGTRDLRYEHVGDEFVVEWRHVRRKGLTEWFSFQIRLNFTTSAVRVVYGEIGQGPATQTTLQPQVGLRGPNNSHANNVDSRRVETGSETWATSLPSNANTNTVRFTSTAPAKFWNEGQQYIWTPSCHAPLGTPCDDGDACTINDVLISGCICAGTFQDTDGDGVCDAEDECPLDPNKILAGNCGCGNLEPGASCDDGNPGTGNDMIQADCSCAGTPIDCLGVIGGPATPGTACNDGDPHTTLDVYDADCNCIGIPCTENVRVAFQVDGNGHETTWEIRHASSLQLMCNGGGWYPNYADGISEDCCLPAGDYILRVFDDGGDGITNGGYILSLAPPDNERIIDNRYNFNSGSESSLYNGMSFGVPLGTDRTIFTSCDKLDWVDGQNLVASLNPAVTAAWIPNTPVSGQSPTTGYEYWFFDPNGTYSYRRFRSHRNNDGYGTLGYDRAAHMRINIWDVANHVPHGVLMNVRVRSVVNDVASEWGPACRFKVDPVLAQCPVTKLMDIPGHVFRSCGQFRNWATNQAVHARPVNGASQYQFHFTSDGGNYNIIRNTNKYFAILGWDPALAQIGQWQVRVRVFRNGGWCDWGEACTVNINLTAPSQNMLADMDMNEPTVTMWPNPNNGDRMFLNLQHMNDETGQAHLDLFDLTGKQVMRRTVAINEGANTNVEFDQTLGNGIYLLNVTSGGHMKSLRMIVTR